MTPSEQKAREIANLGWFIEDKPDELIFELDGFHAAIAKAIDDAVREERKAWEQAVWQYKEVWSDILKKHDNDKFWDTIVTAKLNTLIGVCSRAERARQRSQS